MLKFFVDKAATGVIGIVKIDADKMFRPRPFGWRMIATDLRIAKTGMIVEHYMTFTDMIQANEQWLHTLYEKWRSRDMDRLAVSEFDDLTRDSRISSHAYRELMIDALANEQDGNAMLRVRRGLMTATLTETIEQSIVSAPTIV